MTNLADESCRTPSLHNKYFVMLMKERKALQQCSSVVLKLKVELYEYYSGKSDTEVYKKRPFKLKLLKPEVANYIEADDLMIEAKNNLADREMKINYIEATIKVINQRGFAIKNAIDWQKFQNGGY